MFTFFLSNTITTSVVLELIYVDLQSLYLIHTTYGVRFILTIIDDFSKNLLGHI